MVVWLCFCGCVFVMMLLWWCGGVVVFLLWCGRVFAVLFVWWCPCGFVSVVARSIGGERCREVLDRTEAMWCREVLEKKKKKDVV